MFASKAFLKVSVYEGARSAVLARTHPIFVEEMDAEPVDPCEA